MYFLSDHNDDIKVVTLENAPKNLKFKSPDIQRDIVTTAAIETVNTIMKDVGNGLFSILVVESRDLSMNEHMTIVLR